MKQGGCTKGPFPMANSQDLLSLPYAHAVFLPPVGPKGRLANFYKMLFLPPDSTIHLYLSGKGRTMVNSSAGLTRPYNAGCFLSLLQPSCFHSPSLCLSYHLMCHCKGFNYPKSEVPHF